jgi:hypothetical protein
MPAWLAKPALPWIAAGMLLIGLIIGFFLLRSAWRAEGAQAVEMAVAHAVEKQRAEDAKRSAELTAQLQGQIQMLEANVAPVREEIRYAPVTKGCGPAVGSAARWVRDALGAGGSPAGR